MRQKSVHKILFNQLCILLISN